MRTHPPLPSRLRFENPSLPVVQVEKERNGRLKRVFTKGDYEYETDPRGHYAYELVTDYSYLHQWRIGGDGILHPLSPHQVPAHSHPNTLQFHPNGRFAYVTCSHGAVCQYQVHSGVLVPLKPFEIYAENNPSSLWFDRTGNYACVMTPSVEKGYPPTDHVHVYRIGGEGHLELAHKIAVCGPSTKITHDIFEGNLSSFTVSGDNLAR